MKPLGLGTQRIDEPDSYWTYTRQAAISVFALLFAVGTGIVLAVVIDWMTLLWIVAIVIAAPVVLRHIIVMALIGGGER